MVFLGELVVWSLVDILVVSVVIAIARGQGLGPILVLIELFNEREHNI